MSDERKTLIARRVNSMFASRQSMQSIREVLSREGELTCRTCRTSGEVTVARQEGYAITIMCGCGGSHSLML